MRRFFIAINLPPEVKDKLVKLQKALSQYIPNVRWVTADNLHLTLVFLGAINDLERKKVGQITQEVLKETEPFSLQVKGLGVFPEPKRVRILWAGVFGDFALKLLNRLLFRKLTQAGFRVDEREFTAHITLGRTKAKANREIVSFLLDKYKEVRFGAFEVFSVEIMESQLQRSGPIYRVVEKIELKRFKNLDL
jgi:2'-5' RNA ligase